MSDLFKEVIPSILTSKVPIQDAETSNVPFIVNKALSYHIDTVLYANEMNRNHHLDKKLQYDYLFNSVTKRKRPFVPWSKKENTEHLESIKTYYGCSTQKAREYYSILTDEQKEYIVTKTTIGGITRNAKGL